MVYDHDTMRVAAATTGDFVDWKGIAFDGSHNSHTSLTGERQFVNPVGPGWATPEGKWEDPRPLSREELPYGPLPREWASYEGLYLQGGKAVVALTVGGTRVLESPGWLDYGATPVFARTLNVDEREKRKESQPLVCASRRTASTSSLPATAHCARKPDSGSPPSKVAQRPASSSRKPTPPRSPPSRNPSLTLSICNRSPRAARAAGSEKSPPPLKPEKRTAHFRRHFPAADQEPMAKLDAPRRLRFHTRRQGRDRRDVEWRRVARGWIDGARARAPNVATHRERTVPAARREVPRRRTLHHLPRSTRAAARPERRRRDGLHRVLQQRPSGHRALPRVCDGLADRCGGKFLLRQVRPPRARPASCRITARCCESARTARTTDILANGFRAANGVCLNDDGTFFVTDQEGHWTPKNRINRVKPGGFYGNMFGYTDVTDTADSAMEQPMVWITNAKDRSPAELVWVAEERMGFARRIAAQSQLRHRPRVHRAERGSRRPMARRSVRAADARLRHGIMRGRFATNGDLYTCGMFAWAGNATTPGGFHRIHRNDAPAYLPLSIHAAKGALTVAFSDSLDAGSLKPGNFAMKVWSLKRTANYGSRHENEHPVEIRSVFVSSDGRGIASISLTLRQPGVTN